MTVTGLSGKSGTGKSYNAVELAAKIGASAIIDDGLLISNGRILAGISAKKQKSKIGAVKTAIFTAEEHARDVRDAIQKLKPTHILVLGTSDEMIGIIAKRLELGEVSSIVHIEDITTPEQRELAEHARNDQGMHTIPAPTLQVKKQFSGLLIDPSRAFRRAQDLKISGEHESGQPKKSVVRPTYSYLGSYEISDRCIEQISSHIVNATPGFSKLLFAACTNGDEGMYLRVIVNAKKGCEITKQARILQEHLTSALSHMTAFNIMGVEVEIRGFS